MTANGPPNVERVWEYAIMPLLEERFYGALSMDEIQARFGLVAIEALLARQEPEAEEDDAAPAEQVE